MKPDGKTLLSKGRMLFDEECNILKKYLEEHNRTNHCNLQCSEFFLLFVMKHLQRFKEGEVVENNGTNSNKTSKGIQGVDPKDENNKKRIKALQNTSNIRLVLAQITDTVTSQKIVIQKLESILDLLCNLDAFGEQPSESLHSSYLCNQQLSRLHNADSFFLKNLTSLDLAKVSSEEVEDDPQSDPLLDMMKPG